LLWLWKNETFKANSIIAIGNTGHFLHQSWYTGQVPQQSCNLSLLQIISVKVFGEVEILNGINVISNKTSVYGFGWKVFVVHDLFSYCHCLVYDTLHA